MLRVKIAGILLFGILCAGLGAFGWSKTHTPQVIEKLVVKEIEKPVFTYIKQVDQNDIQALRDWYNSPLRLEHTVKGSDLFIRATDGTKQTDMTLQISESTSYKVYFGVGAVCIAAGAYGMYKILK